MRIVIDDNTQKVHLLGLDWGDVALIEACLAEKAVIIANEKVSARAVRLIELMDAGTASVLAAHLGSEDASEESDNL